MAATSASTKLPSFENATDAFNWLSEKLENEMILNDDHTIGASDITFTNLGGRNPVVKIKAQLVASGHTQKQARVCAVFELRSVTKDLFNVTDSRTSRKNIR